MQATSIDIKSQVLQELANNRLIGDVANDYGLTRRTIYAWIKSEQTKDKKSKVRQANRLKAKLAKLNQELQQLKVA